VEDESREAEDVEEVFKKGVCLKNKKETRFYSNG